MAIKKIIKEIENLVSPLSEKTYSIEDALRKKVKDLEYSRLLSLEGIDQILEKSEAPDKSIPPNELNVFASWVEFLRLLLDRLLCLRTEAESDSSHLFSLSQQRMLKSTFEIIVCLGILPHLGQGIGVPIAQRLPDKRCLPFLNNATSDDEKYYALNLTLFSLFELLSLDTFNSILINNYLGDMIAGAIQLIVDKRATKPDLLKQHLRNIIENTYQPFVIKELMVMLGNKEVPKGVFRWLRRTLSERLLAEGGLVATLRAILDLTGSPADTPHYWEHVYVLARLITTSVHAPLYPQIFELLKSKSNEYRQVAIMSVKVLSESSPEDCQTHFIAPLLKPILTASGETEFGEALEALHASCAHSTAPWAVSPQTLSSAFVHIIKLNAKIRTSVSYLKSKAGDLAWSILSHEETNLEVTLINSIFNTLPVSYQLGSEGGVVVHEGKDDLNIEDIADSILELYLSRDNTNAKIRFFKTLLICITKEHTLEKQLIFSKLLSELCSDSDVQKSLSKDPLCIIPFIKVLLEAPDSYGSETVCLGLMVLGIVVDTPPSHKPIDWSQLDVLIEPLKDFKSSSTEANVLANELYELIMTKGVVRKKPKKAEKVQTSLEKALSEAVDPLLPVRAHGIRELGKLILARDPQTLAKKETIFFIFKENLKDEDSYIYLSSVEGLAALSASFPDEVILTLIEEYQSKSHSVEDRLKVGEVLVKVARLLNEMAIIYKKELISCFLVGCTNDDPLMRASSLSNLGEICKILSFRITAYIVEILECVRSIYETDKHPEARRAAVMVLTLLLKGLGEGALSTLEPVLLELYRGLKRVYELDKDDITRLHAQLALEELRSSTLVFLSPVRPLEKRIYVLDPPE